MIKFLIKKNFFIKTRILTFSKIFFLRCIITHHLINSTFSIYNNYHQDTINFLPEFFQDID